ncbi:unnamed protein product [Prunus brigantina]
MKEDVQDTHHHLNPRTTLPRFRIPRAFMVERNKDKEISGVEAKRGDSRRSKDPKRNRTKS